MPGCPSIEITLRRQGDCSAEASSGIVVQIFSCRVFSGLGSPVGAPKFLKSSVTFKMLVELFGTSMMISGGEWQIGGLSLNLHYSIYQYIIIFA